MRLVCPNCEAQYEVPDNVIPQEGRDVQCSSCGDTWFQPFGQPAKAAATGVGLNEADEFYEDIVEPESDFETAQFFADDDDFEADLADEIGVVDYDTDADDGDLMDEDAPAAPPADAPARTGPETRIPRRELEPSVAQVLREEAERESRARAKEASAGLESQPDLGLDAPEDDAAGRDRDARKRLDKIKGKGEDALSSAVAEAIAISRRDLLPDVEEINSSLRSSSDRPAAEIISTDDEDEDPAYRSRKRGFRSGFSMTLLLAVLLFSLYVLTPKIIAAFPESEPYLVVYVENVDKGRVWLDGQMRVLMRWIETKAAS